MSWQEYERTTRRNPTPGVKVSNDGMNLNFNCQAANGLLLDVDALVLLWDGERIAFRPVSFKHRNGYSLAHVGGYAWLNCRGFIQSRGLHRRQRWELSALGDLIVGDPA